MLELREVAYRYPEAAFDAVCGISLAVAPGERVCLMGANGSGKSTVARLACADLLPTAGVLLVDGTATTDPGCEGRVSFVGQDPREQITSVLVAEEVAFGPRCQLLTDGAIQVRVEEALATCGIAHLYARAVNELSGGETQLVALAGALATQPRYLVLDEASSHLDADARARLASVLASLCEQGLGILEITHDPREARTADRVIVMERGRCLWQGTPTAWEAWRYAQQASRRAQQGAEVGDLGFAAPERPCALALDAVSRSYGSHTVLDAFSVMAAPGELVLLCGPSGAGKTTAARLLAGVDKPDAGHALLGTAPVRAGQVGLAFQRPEDQLFAPTVWEDVAYGPRNRGCAQDELARRVRQALEALYVPEDLWQAHAQQLSGGMRRRVALASIVALAPSAYVLDEPTAGLDEEGRALLHSLVARVRAAGCPVVLVTHEPQEWAAEATKTVELRGNVVVKSGAEMTPEVLYLSTGGEPPERPPLARIDPRVRVLGLLALTVALFIGPSTASVCCAALLTGMLSAFAHVDLRKLGRVLLPATPLLVVVLLANAVRVDGSADLLLGAQIGVSSDGLHLGAVAVVRIVMLVCLVAAMTTDLSMTDIIRLVESGLAPLKRLGVSTSEVSMIISTTLSLIPQAYEEFGRIATAQRSRGAPLDEGRIVERLRAWYAVMTPLVVVLFTRSDALARSMRLRGFRGSMTLPRRQCSSRDWIMLLLMLAAAAAIAWL